MKKLLMLVVLSGLVVACSEKKTETAEAPVTDVAAEQAAAPAGEAVPADAAPAAEAAPAETASAEAAPAH